MRLDRAKKRAARTGGFCYLCGHQMRSIRACNVDHIVPKSMGGCHGYRNMALVHAACNVRKADNLPTPLQMARLLELRRKYYRTGDVEVMTVNELVRNYLKPAAAGKAERILAQLTS